MLLYIVSVVIPDVLTL